MYQKISNNEFYKIKDQQELFLIDVREEDEFAESHIQGALNMPLSDFQQSFQILDSRKKYHLICHSGIRSAMDCQFLADQGYEVTNILGGMSFWKGDLVHGDNG